MVVDGWMCSVVLMVVLYKVFVGGWLLGMG